MRNYWIIDTRHKHCISWIPDINILYHGYQTKYGISPIQDKNNLYHGYQTLRLCILETRNKYCTKMYYWASISPRDTPGTHEGIVAIRVIFRSYVHISHIEYMEHKYITGKYPVSVIRDSTFVWVVHYCRRVVFLLWGCSNHYCSIYYVYFVPNFGKNN